MPNAEEIFHIARQIPSPEARKAYLDVACANDAALRAKVEALLAADAGAGEFLATKSQTATALGPVTEKPGERIGHYKLLQLIGEGGFGSVFLAEQTEPVRRRVALKIIKLGMDTRQVIARFEAERQALAMMDHPHIARVLDGGATASGRPYFVMEYVTGDAITKFADAHKLDVPARLELFAQVCQAVQHAHTKGIIHRDLKPGNILVSMSDGRPFAKVIDFGIAKATSGSSAHLTDKTLFTEHRQLIGTPEYMSPEQAEGSADIDTRTDVYALGVLLYELLTGLTPFDGARLRSAAWGELQRIIKEEEPLAPSVRLSKSLEQSAALAAARQAEPSKLGLLIKGELDWIVLKAMDKDRARRYESPSQLAADVERHLSGEAVVAAPASAGYRLRKFVRRNKGAVVGVLAVVLAFAVGGSVALWQWKRAEQHRRVAEDISSKLRAENDRAIENALNLTKTLWESKYYSGMKPKPGMLMSISSLPYREIRITRGKDESDPYAIVAVDADKKEVSATAADAWFAANTMMAYVFGGFESASSSLQEQTEIAEKRAAEARSALALVQERSERLERISSAMFAFADAMGEIATDGDEESKFPKYNSFMEMLRAGVLHDAKEVELALRIGYGMACTIGDDGSTKDLAAAITFAEQNFGESAGVTVQVLQLAASASDYAEVTDAAADFYFQLAEALEALHGECRSDSAIAYMKSCANEEVEDLNPLDEELTINRVLRSIVMLSDEELEAFVEWWEGSDYWDGYSYQDYGAWRLKVDRVLASSFDESTVDWSNEVQANAQREAIKAHVESAKAVTTRIPNEPWPQIELAWAHLAAKDSAAALASCESAAKTLCGEGKPIDHPHILGLMAIAQLQLGKSDEGLASLAKLRAIMSDPANSETWAKEPDATELLKWADRLAMHPPEVKK